MAAAIVGTAAVVMALSILFWLPFVYCKVVRKDYTIRFYHFFLGPALWWRQAPADAGQIQYVPDYRIRKTEDADKEIPQKETDEESGSMEKRDSTEPVQPSALNQEVEKVDEHPIEGAWAEPKNLWIILRYVLVYMARVSFLTMADQSVI